MPVFWLIYLKPWQGLMKKIADGATTVAERF